MEGEKFHDEVEKRMGKKLAMDIVQRFNYKGQDFVVKGNDKDGYQGEVKIDDRPHLAMNCKSLDECKKKCQEIIDEYSK